MGSLKEGVEKGAFIETSPLILHLMVAGGTLLFRTIESIKEKRPEVTVLFNQIFPGGSGSFADEIENIILQGIRKEGVSHA
jgi:hypothetical protein